MHVILICLHHYQKPKSPRFCATTQTLILILDIIDLSQHVDMD